MGLSTRAVVRRLRAWHYGGPLPCGETIRNAVADPDHILQLAFVKMGGESRPWAVAWRDGRQPPEFRFVPEPRFRAGVSEMVADLAPVLARHLRHPTSADRAVGDVSELAPLRQVWLPNDSHVAMLHNLAYAYARQPRDDKDSDALRLLGRTALFLFLHAQRPGQQLVMSASDVLRSAYDFPAEDTRQAHLGFLLAWLSARSDRERGLAAALEAERAPMSTPLLPELERDVLAEFVEAHNDARRANDADGMRQATDRIGTVLTPELERRLGLTDQAIDVVRTDQRPVNAGVEVLVRESLERQWWDYVRPEARAIAEDVEPFVPSPETDFAARQAARRYFTAAADADRVFDALVHHDRELEAEAIAVGRAFRGTITMVVDEGSGKKKTPVWLVEDPTPGPLSLREGDRVCVVGYPKRKGVIREISAAGRGGLVIELVITEGKNAPRAAVWPHSMSGVDPNWVGQPVTLVGSSFAGMTDRKAQLVATRDPLPGDWIVDRDRRDGAESEAVA